MSDYKVIVEADDDRDDHMAARVAEILCEAYPGHPWHVRIGGGLLIVKHCRLSNSHGMARKYSRVTFDAGVLKRSIVFAAGEFLERAGKTRGAFAEHEWERKVVVEGIPDKHLVAN